MLKYLFRNSTLFCLSLLLFSKAHSVESFTESIFKQVINKVSVVDVNSGSSSLAVKGEVFQAPNLIKTGRKSRTQLEASDGTITRVGSNTVFSFEPNSRTIKLEKGNLLFNSPTGKGGGKIVTASASASVLGTTLAVSATPDGGFKVMCIEGKVQLDFVNGQTQVITAGQMSFVMPGQIQAQDSPSANQQQSDPATPSTDQASTDVAPAGQAGPVLNFDLEAQVQGSALVGGFDAPLPSIGKIESAVKVQRQEIKKGGLKKTGALIVGAKRDKLTLLLDVKDRQSGEEDAQTLTSSTGESLVQGIKFDLEKALAKSLILGDGSGVSSIHKALGETDINLNSDIFSNQFTVTDSHTDDISPNSTTKYFGIFAKNIALKPTNDKLNLSTVDGPTRLLMVAQNTLSFDGSISITGLGTTRNLLVIASVFSGPDGSSSSPVVVQASVSGKLGIFGLSGFSMRNYEFKNESGGLEFFIQSSLTGTNVDFRGSSSNGEVSVDTQGALSLTRGSAFGHKVRINGDTSSTIAGVSGNRYQVRSDNTITLDTDGVQTLKFAKIFGASNSVATTVDIYGKTILMDVVNVDASTLRIGSYTATGASTSTASDYVTVGFNVNTNAATGNGVNNFTDVASLNISAQTVYLANVIFNSGGTILMKSNNGKANVGSSPMVNYVNFISNVYVGSVSAGNSVVSNPSNFINDQGSFSGTGKIIQIQKL